MSYLGTGDAASKLPPCQRKRDMADLDVISVIRSVARRTPHLDVRVMLLEFTIATRLNSERLLPDNNEML